MGMYDTFIDGNKEMQVKCFRNMLDKFHAGDTIPYEELGCPKDIIVYDYDNLLLIIKDGKFVKITDNVNELPDFPIIDYLGTLKSKEFILSKFSSTQISSPPPCDKLSHVTQKTTEV
ncbi:MAG: hypothetical protein ACE5FT_06660 [Candidatus Nanoarchaeia archaeon]